MTLQLSTTQLTLVAMKAQSFLLVVFPIILVAALDENSIGISEKLASDDNALILFVMEVES